MYKVPQRQVHLDFHTSPAIKDIGKEFNEEQFIDCLKVGHVNSITLFAKCHHGWSYYPSKVNAVHPELKFDLLSAQLSACKKANVSAPVYISVGFDDKYFFEHPTHGVAHTREHVYPNISYKDGLPYAEDDEYNGFRRLCLNTPYLDEVVKQTEEIVKLYNPEGLFFDIVGEELCFCPHCVESVKALGWDESDDESFRKLAKLTYKKYYDAVNNCARAIKPDIKLFHNGGHIPCGKRDLVDANTHLELESLPTGGWGYDHFPKSAKYVCNLDKKYLGMTGKFHRTWGEFGGFKHPNALRYEVALSLAFGARCSIGDQMHPLGFMDKATYELIGTAYSEAELVEDYCYDIEPIVDVGLLSVEALSVSGQKSNTDTGVNRILLEGKYLYSILDKDCDFSKYKVIILPDDINLSDETVCQKLKAFIDNGGKILSTGKSGEVTLKNFDLGCTYNGVNEYSPNYIAPDYNAISLAKTKYVIYEKFYDVDAKSGATVSANVANPYFNRDKYHYCSHKHTPFTLDKGNPVVTYGTNGAYIAIDIFSEYATYGSYIAKETVIKVLDNLLLDGKTLKTNLLSAGVVSLNKQADKNRYVLHALYGSPIKRGDGAEAVEVIEDLVPIYNTTFEISLDKKVKSVKIVPQNKKIKFKYKDGKLTFTIDKFECKQVVSIEY